MRLFLSRTHVLVEMWEYETIYIHNTHPNVRQGEVEFESHKDVEYLNQHSRER